MTAVKEPPVKAQITDKDNRPTSLWAHWFQNIYKAISDSESASSGTHATSDGTSHSHVVLNDAHRGSSTIHLTAVQKDDLTDGGETTLHGHPIVTISATGFCPTLPNDTALFLGGDGLWRDPVVYLRAIDTAGDHYLYIYSGEDLTADKILTFITGDVSRTITLSGNPTLADWFDQNVKTTGSPVFVTVKLSALSDGKIPYHVNDATGLADGPFKIDVDSAVSLKHTQGSDTALGAVGTKNPPIDADKAIYRDSTASDALVTSTWTQIKAFLKTYFDTLYNLYVHPNHSGDVTSVADGAQTIGAKKVTVAMLADGTDGQLITWGADGVAAVVATGNAGQVLTSGGAGVAPTFQAASGGVDFATAAILGTL